MSDREQPQIYLITPPAPEPENFAGTLARVLDGRDVACVRLALATSDERALCLTADTLRPVCHDRDIPLVIENHYLLVDKLGLDGVHLSGGGRNTRAVRKALGADAIIGAHCGTSRHAGLTAGEAGADYIAFGPAGATALGDGSVAERELFRWWSEMIELPVVAEGALDHDLIETLAPVADFFGVGPEIWDTDDPLEALRALTAPIG